MAALFWSLAGLYLALCLTVFPGLLFKASHSREHCPYNWRILLGAWITPYFDWRDKNHPDWWRHP